MSSTNKSEHAHGGSENRDPLSGEKGALSLIHI